MGVPEKFKLENNSTVDELKKKKKQGRRGRSTLRCRPNLTHTAFLLNLVRTHV
ncbi:hypothetical protein BHM03_00038258 [Ensete ventricosum]|nr:hypothetical protein BHM03_00038258 [Ensete ventricosum]